MKYSDSVKAILPAAIDGLAADPEKYAKRPGRDFTRNRKPGFKQLILMLLTMEGGMHPRGTLHIFWPQHGCAFQNCFL